MFNYTEIKAQLDRAKTIDLPFDKQPSVRPLGRRLALEWVWFLVKYRRRSKLFQAYACHGDEVFETFTIEYTKRAITHLESYVDTARKEFIVGRASFFLKCRLKTKGEFRKHWPQPGKNNAQIQARTSTSLISVFRTEFTERDALAGLHLAMAAYFDRMWANTLPFVAVDFEHDIGFSSGQPSHFVLYDINYSPPEAHCYPIPEREARREKTLSLSNFSMNFSLNPPSLKTAL